MEKQSENTSYELEVVNIRLVREPSLYSEKPIRNPDDAVELMAKELAMYDREVMCLLNVNANGQVINMNIVSMGSIDQTLVSPREFFKSSILSNARSVIALHNHPSGSTTPSWQDINTTKLLAECGELLDIPLLDHIIVGGSNGTIISLKEKGLMDSGRSDKKGSVMETAMKETKKSSKKIIKGR